MENRITALVGMCGAGKSVAAEVFAAHGWETVYFGGVTLTELEKRGLEKNEKNERAVREELRARYGQGAFAVLLEPVIREKIKSANVVLDGLYSWSELKILSDAFGSALSVVAVVTDRDKRYERLSKRPLRPLSPAEAEKRDRSEIENLEKGGPIGFADRYISNNGTVRELRSAVETYISSL